MNKKKKKINFYDVGLVWFTFIFMAYLLIEARFPELSNKIISLLLVGIYVLHVMHMSLHLDEERLGKKVSGGKGVIKNE